MARAAKIAVDAAEAIRLIACLADEVTCEAASRATTQLGWTESVVLTGGIAMAGSAVTRFKPPKLLLVDLTEAPDPAGVVGELIKQCGAGTRILAIGTVNDVTLFRKLAALGVADYLVKPVSSELLCDAFRQALRIDEQTAAPKSRTRIQAFIGTRGGVGTTTTALATAWLLVHEHKLRTALIDLDLHFGNLALSVDLEPGRGLRQALENPERTDGLLLASAMVKAGDKLPILAGEEPLEEMLHFDPAAASAVLNALSQDYDCLIVDVPRSLDGASRQIIAAAETTVIVTDLSLAALRDSLRLIDLVKSLGSSTAPVVIASQVGAMHRGEIGKAEFERGLGRPLDFQVPFDAKAARAMAHAAKVMPAAASSSKASAELRRVAAKLAGREEKARGLKRWFG